jgi:hypothetical protein
VQAGYKDVLVGIVRLKEDWEGEDREEDDRD